MTELKNEDSMPDIDAVPVVEPFGEEHDEGTQPQSARIPSPQKRVLRPRNAQKTHLNLLYSDRTQQLQKRARWT